MLIVAEVDVVGRLDGKWRDFEKSDAAIRVKLFGPLFWTFHRDVLWSAHGPVFKTRKAATAFALEYAETHTRVIDFDVRRV